MIAQGAHLSAVTRSREGSIVVRGTSGHDWRPKNRARDFRRSAYARQGFRQACSMERRGSRCNARVDLGGIFCESAADFRGTDFPGEQIRGVGAEVAELHLPW